VIGQARAHDITWDHFKTRVLDELDADLAICIDTDPNFDFANPFYRFAKYKWFNPMYRFGEYDKAFDAVQRFYGYEADWRVLLALDGTMFGGIHPHKTVAAMLYFQRWILLQNIVSADLLSRYDRFVLTRSDFLFACPHPRMKLLDPDYIWIPDGEDWGGYCDRHMVVSTDHFTDALNVLEPLLKDPHGIFEKYSSRGGWNIEKCIRANLEQRGLDSRVRRFPYSMFLVRGENDGPSWTPGSYSEEAGAIVKYPSEYALARTFETTIRDANDWERFFRLRNASRAIFIEAIAAGMAEREDPRAGAARADALGGIPYWSDIRHELAGQDLRPTGKLAEVIGLALDAANFDVNWYRAKNREVSHFDDATLHSHWRTGGYFEGRLPRERWGLVALAERLRASQG
jgi:hypothetical protein